MLPRLMKSAVGVIDYYYACDTGSTDDTVNVIKSYFADHGIPGQVVTHDWENFGR